MTSLDKTSSSFTPQELNRYSRHFSLPTIGIEGQLKLKAARVLCIGVGGLGAPLLLYLAAAGVGTIGVVDDDVVDLSNLQRQVLYGMSDLGKPKVAAAQARLAELNPHVALLVHQLRLTKANVLSILQEYDIIVDGSDNFATRYLVNDACFHLQKPNVYASIFQFEGQCSVFNMSRAEPCYRCLFDSPPPVGLIPNCAEGGVLGVLPGIMGSIQATEVIKLITDIGKTLVGRLLTFDALAMRFQEFELRQDPNCRLCVHKQSFESLPNYEDDVCSMPNAASEPHSVKEITVQELALLQQQSAEITLLDVREPYEYAICHIGGVLIPLAQLTQQLDGLAKEQAYIVMCRSGVRSWQAVQLMQAMGFTDVKNLQGGILAWAREVDKDMVIY